jgi:hypothetical protein
VTAQAIARLKITLADVTPKVLRRIEVPLALKLDRLHLVIQAAMGWSNYHLYEIRAGGAGWGEPDPDGVFDGPLDAKKARLIDVLEDTGAKTLQYLYDFGDGWEHTVKIERFVDPVPGVLYPFLLQAEGRCPPEDSGGPWGYADFLEAFADPRHERHEEMIAWIGEDFDPTALDTHALAANVEALAKRWIRKPPARRKL